MATPRNPFPNQSEIDRLLTTLIKDPRSKAFIPLADEYMKADMCQDAVAVLEEGLKVFPGFITAMVALGRAYTQQGQSNKAKGILEEAVKLSPDNLRAHRLLAKIYVAEGAMELAQRSCRTILTASPQDEDALRIIRTLERSSPAPSVPSSGSPASSEPPPKTSLPQALEGSPSGSMVWTAASLTPEPEAAGSLPPEPSHTTRSEESQTEVTASNGQSEEGTAKTARLENWLKAIQAKRRATA